MYLLNDVSGQLLSATSKGSEKTTKLMILEMEDELGNEGLHRGSLDPFTNLLSYKAKVEGIDVVVVNERDTSKAY